MKNLLITLGSIILVIGGIVGFTMKANADKSAEDQIIDHSEPIEEVEENESDNNIEIEEPEEKADKSEEVEETDEDTITEEKEDSEVSKIKDLAEYGKLKSSFDVSDYDAHVKKDNEHKRIILFTDDDKYVQYKSIFIKHQDRLKVIDKNKGLIFNEKIDTVQKATKKDDTVKKEKSTSKSQAKKSSSDEMSVVKKHIDVNKYTPQTVEDNSNKRVILYKEGKGKPAYKSIFVKEKSWLKIIDTSGGLVFNDRI